LFRFGTVGGGREGKPGARRIIVCVLFNSDLCRRSRRTSHTTASHDLVVIRHDAHNRTVETEIHELLSRSDNKKKILFAAKATNLGIQHG